MITKLDLAEAQLLGWYAGKHGTSLISFKRTFPTVLNEREKKEIDEYFHKQS